VISEDLGMKLETMDVSMLGSAKKVSISKDDTIVLDGSGEAASIEERCEQIRDAVRDLKSLHPSIHCHQPSSNLEFTLVSGYLPSYTPESDPESSQPLCAHHLVHPLGPRIFIV
jgi:hypothetical protein